MLGRGEDNSVKYTRICESNNAIRCKTMLYSFELISEIVPSGVINYAKLDFNSLAHPKDPKYTRLSNLFLAELVAVLFPQHNLEGLLFSWP